MKKFVATITTFATFFQAVPAMAWVGGPYSNNIADGRAGGVFQGTISMKNGSGMFRFATSSEPFLSPNANAVIIHKGITYFGDCFGMVDGPSKRISGITNGLSNISTDTVVQPTGGSFINLGNAITINSNTVPIGAPNIQFGNGLDNFVCNSEWSGRIQGPRPGMTFKAKGYAHFFSAADSHSTSTYTLSGNYTTNAANISNPSTGGDLIVVGPYNIVRTLATTPVTTVTTNVTVPGSIRADVTNEASSKEKVKIKVFGSRVSPIAYTQYTNAAPNP